MGRGSQSQLGALGFWWMGSQSQLGALGAGVRQGPRSVWVLCSPCEVAVLGGGSGPPQGGTWPLLHLCLFPASCFLHPACSLLPACSPPAPCLLPASSLPASCSFPVPVSQCPPELCPPCGCSTGAHRVRPPSRQQGGREGCTASLPRPHCPLRCPRSQLGERGAGGLGDTHTPLGSPHGSGHGCDTSGSSPGPAGTGGSRAGVCQPR